MTTWSPWRRTVAGALLLALAFIAANRAAWRGYFSADDLDNILQTRSAPAVLFLKALVDPRLSDVNFRPVGHGVYKLLAGFRLDFRPYLAALQGLHLLNLALLALLLRRLGATERGTWAGVIFHAFQLSCFAAYWKPMYVFDVVCATFVLLALLCYLHGRWLLGLVPFWLAFKAKEPAIALPAALLLYEFMLGRRRWRRTLPYAAVSLLFGAQALLHHGPVTDYTLRFTPAALWQTLAFYSSRILLLPYAGAALILTAVLVRDRRVRFGLAALALLMGPMWFLPSRLNAVYLYLPLIGAAIALAFAAERHHWSWTATAFAIWIPANYLLAKPLRNVELTAAIENRAYVQQAAQLAASAAVVYDGHPQWLERWGVEAAFHLARPGRQVASAQSEAGKRLLGQPNVAVVAWNDAERRLMVSQSGAAEPAMVDFAQSDPAAIFESGWHEHEAGFRWTEPEAVVRLHRPADEAAFVVCVNVVDIQKRVEMEVLVDGHSVGRRVFPGPGPQEQRWLVPAGPDGVVRVTLRTLNPLKGADGDPRQLGAAVVRFGFVGR
jgi:hypothetical protein